MRITRLGHACLLVEGTDIRVLIDPGGFSDARHVLEDADVVLVTHQHADHVDTENVAPLVARTGARVWAEGAVVPLLATNGVEAHAAAPGQHIDLGSLQVDVTGGTHAEIYESIPRIGNLGYVLSETNGPRLYHPGDSYEYPLSGIDVLALPLTAPWARMAMTAEFLAAVTPSRAFPIHDAIVNGTGWSLYMRLCREVTGMSLDPVRPDGSLDL